MVNRHRLILAKDLAPAQYWPRVAELAQEEMHRLELPIRDAIMLVPLLEHIHPARMAFCGLPGWPPRVETVSSCALAAGPPRTKPVGSLVGDPAVDGAMALALMRRQSWTRNLRSADAKAFGNATSALIDLAQEWHVAIGSLSPDGREAMIEHARALLQSNAGLGMLETALSRIALEWSALDCSRDADALARLMPSAC